MVISTCINIIQENIIEYCETWHVRLNVEGWLLCLWTYNIIQMMGIFLTMMIMNLLKARKGQLRLVGLPLQVKMNLLWMVLEDPVKIQVQMC